MISAVGPLSKYLIISYNISYTGLSVSPEYKLAIADIELLERISSKS